MRFAFLFLASLYSIQAAALPRAQAFLRILAEVGEDNSVRMGFWKSKAAQKVGKEPFAYGFDAELWHASDMVRMAGLTEAGTDQGRDALIVANLTFTRDALATKLGVTSRALTSHLHPEFADQTVFTLFDLKKESLKKVKDTLDMKATYGHALRQALQTSLNELGLDITADWEGSSGALTQGPLGSGGTIEMKMNGPVTKPNDFRAIIKDFLHKEAEWPETHLHLSIPSKSVNAKHVMLAARALEMKIILEELVAGLDYDGNLVPYEDSVLAQGPEDFDSGVGRGVVRVDIDQWTEPVPAHDVEFRMWLDADGALENIRFFQQLIKKRRSLLDTGDFVSVGVRGVMPANLNSSLKYAAYLLDKQSDASGREHTIALQLNRYAKQLEDAGTVTPEKRKQIAKYMKENYVLKYFTLESFLK